LTDLLLSEEEKMLQTTVRNFADRELAPRAQELDEREEFSWDIWNGMASLGLMGVGIDPKYGGSGGGYRQVAIVEEEVARGDAATSVSLVAHMSLANRTIYNFGDENQKLEFVPPITKGEKVAAWALTEPGGGSDAAALQTTATLHNGTYYLNGSKIFITNGDIAEYVVVFATKDKSLKHQGISAFIVTKDTPGFQATKQRGKLGMRGSPTTELLFEDCPVPQERLVGQEGRGFNHAMDVLDSSRPIIAAQCVGIAQAALEASVRYAQQRTTFGRFIAEHQAIQFMLADMATEIYASRVATMHACTLKDNGLPFLNEASMAKLLASETAVRVTSNAIQIHGGYGYFKDSPVERYFRDARVTTIYEGTSEVQRLIIARQLLSAHNL
jgi:butyryl-CoA dehydrogenase